VPWTENTSTISGWEALLFEFSLAHGSPIPRITRQNGAIPFDLRVGYRYTIQP
jgi:hypothetical protein